MMDHSALAESLFRQGYNCSQAVLAAFGDVTGLAPDTALRLASSFGGGMGRLREVCGAVTGMFMAAGLLYGYADPSDSAAKTAHYQRIQELARAFQAENGSIVCRELLGLDCKADSPTPAARTADYYQKRPCQELVGCAARILDAYIREHPVT